MRTIATDDPVVWCVCKSCLFVMRLCPLKAAERIEMLAILFGVDTPGGPGYTVLYSPSRCDHAALVKCLRQLLVCVWR